MKKIYTYHYTLNDFANKKEKVLNLNSNFNKLKDTLKVLDKCIKSPKQSVVDKIIKFSKS